MLGELSALSAAFTWGMTSVVVRPLAAQLPPTVINAARISLAAVLMLAMLPLGGDPLRVSPTAYLLMLASVTVGLGLGDALYFESLRRIGVARAAPIGSAYPLFTTALAVVFLAEPLTGRMLLGVVATVLGVYLVAQPGRLVSPLDLLRGPTASGSGIALLAAFLWSCSTVLMRPALAEADVFIANAFRMPASALITWLIAWRVGSAGAIRQVQGRLLALMLLAGLLTVCSGLGFVGAIAFAGATKAATITSTAPLFAVTCSALLLREKLTRRIVVGTLLSIGGVWLLVASG